MSPPLPPAPPGSANFEIVPDEEPKREYVWTKEDIDRADCQFVNLADIYDRCEHARYYPLSRVRLRLCVKWGTATHVLRGDPLETNVTKEEIGMSWGCSPPGASTPSNKCYLVEVWGLNPKTGNLVKRISGAKDGAFVIGEDEAPIRRWEFADGSAHAEMKREMKDYVASRARQDGLDARTGKPWVDENAGGDFGPPGFDNLGFDGRDVPRAPNSRRVFDDHGIMDDEEEEEVAVHPAQRQRQMQYAASMPPHPAPPARGPNGEDVFVPGHNIWVNSPARQAELQREAERQAELKAAQDKLDAMQRLIEQQQAERKAEREAAERTREKEEAERKEAERERKAREERQAFEQQLLEMQRKSDERLAQMMEAMRRPATVEAPKNSLPEIVTAVGSALAPILGVLKDGRDREREEARLRAEAEKEARRLSEERAEKEATRRHERDLADLKAREERDREDRKRDREFQAQLLNRGPAVDPTVVTMQAELKALAKAVERATERNNRENTPDSRNSLEAELSRFKSIAKIMGYDRDNVVDSAPEESTGDLLKQAGEVVAPILDAGIKFASSRLATADAREARREEREEARHLREELKAKPRNPSYLENPDGSLTPMERARLANGTEVVIPPDHVMLADGSACITIPNFPAFVARRTAALEAQRQMVLQGQPANYLPPPMPEPEFMPDPTGPAPMPFETGPAPVMPAAAAPEPPTPTLPASGGGTQLPLGLTTEARPVPSMLSARDRLAQLKPARYVAPAPSTPTSEPATTETDGQFNESTSTGDNESGS